MITEDYVSFEVAQLLKKKGFNEFCDRYVDTKENYEKEEWTTCIVTSKDIGISTLQTAMKWLRNIHHLHILIDRSAVHWYYKIRKIKSFGTDDVCTGVDFDTYEKAADAAVKYCLENLV